MEGEGGRGKKKKTMKTTDNICSILWHCRSASSVFMTAIVRSILMRMTRSSEDGSQISQTKRADALLKHKNNLQNFFRSFPVFLFKRRRPAKRNNLTPPLAQNAERQLLAAYSVGCSRPLEWTSGVAEMRHGLILRHAAGTTT